MNALDQEIQRERQKRFRRTVLFGIFIAVVLLLYTTWLLIARGYGITVLPKEIQNNYRIHFDAGNGFTIGSALYVFSKNATLTISAPEFIDETISLTPNSSKQILVTLTPKPALLIGKTQGAFDDTVWSIGNTAIHTGKEIKHTLPPGEYQLTIDQKEHLPIQETITLSRAETLDKTWILEKAIANIRISTIPAGAEITLNQNPVGLSPINTEQSVGSYQLNIQKQGFQKIEDTIDVTNKNLSMTKTYTLKALPQKTRKTKPQKTAKTPPPFSVSDLGIQMLRIKPTAFTMGSPPNEKGRLRNEFPLKVDFTRAIRVSRHEITEAQYAAFDPRINTSNLPVTNISWLDAVRYCNWLSEKVGIAPFYTFSNGKLTGINSSANGYRLPTEAEWEWLAKKAKRAQTTKFIWGNSERIPTNAGNFADQSISASRTFTLANYNDNVSNKAPIGTFNVDRIGLYDMAGNVSEWVHDLYTNTPPALNQTAIDYLGPTRGIGHVVKGGNYHTGRIAELRSAYRNVSQKPDATIGFRIARYD